MYNEVLEVFNRHHEIRIKELVEEVSSYLNLSDEEKMKMLSTKKATIIYDRIGWTRTYLVKAGLVENVRRGVYRITEEGKAALLTKQRITNDYLMKYKSFVEFIRPVVKKNVEQSDNTEHILEDNFTPDENIKQAVRMIHTRLSDDLLDVILSKNPIFFEKLVLDLIEKMGYAFDEESIVKTSYIGDEGIDGIIKEDRFGFNSIYVQAKRWKGSVGRPEIQKFLGAVAGQGGTKGLFITTSKFTNEAIDFANKQLQVKLVLVDGKALTDLMIQYGLGVSTIRTYELKQIDMDYFEDEV